MTNPHPRFVTIDYFMKEMLGYKSRISYYNHVSDRGWPQRVYPGVKPMLVFDECVAYQRELMAARESTPASPASLKKRRTGRPVKAPVAQGPST